MSSSDSSDSSFFSSFFSSAGRKTSQFNKIALQKHTYIQGRFVNHKSRKISPSPAGAAPAAEAPPPGAAAATATAPPAGTEANLERPTETGTCNYLLALFHYTVL